MHGMMCWFMAIGMGLCYMGDNETASLPIVYLYYDKSNATLKDGNSAHVLESIWNSYVPALKYDSPASSNGYSYQSPYFTTTDYKYFIVNANSSRDSLKAYPVESRSGAAISAAPARVTYNGKTYEKAENPINISTTPTPDPDPVPDTGTQKNGWCRHQMEVGTCTVMMRSKVLIQDCIAIQMSAGGM